MSLAEFEPAIRATERSQPHALDDAEIVFIDLQFKGFTELVL
jgi:hypothetical protein